LESIPGLLKRLQIRALACRHDNSKRRTGPTGSIRLAKSIPGNRFLAISAEWSWEGGGGCLPRKSQPKMIKQYRKIYSPLKVTLPWFRQDFIAVLCQFLCLQVNNTNSESVHGGGGRGLADQRFVLGHLADFNRFLYYCIPY
jgi:hypothetical protein